MMRGCCVLHSPHVTAEDATVAVSSQAKTVHVCVAIGLATATVSLLPVAVAREVHHALSLAACPTLACHSTA